jgi:bifunctional non-homologous end joining protein LigD
MASESVTVEVEGRQLVLTNLSKVLYPQTGFTKAEVIDYYTRIAPVLLPHLQGRPLTVKRYPNGVEASFFYEKNAPRNTPDWVPTVRLEVPGSTMDRTSIDYLLVTELATLVWLANQAALELHVPQWRVDCADTPLPDNPPPVVDQIVFDLDPGPPASIVECAEVALLLRDDLLAQGLDPVVKTSGSKGIQVTAAVQVEHPQQTSVFAKSLATQFAESHPKQVVSVMAKNLRHGKVFIDWSQNNTAKTTVAPYSLRAKEVPSVSTPLRWEELSEPQKLRFDAGAVLTRVERFGDLFAGALLRPAPQLPSAGLV